MSTHFLEIIGWDQDRAWTDWSGVFRSDLAHRLQSACPSPRLTERKRLAREIASRMSIRIAIERKEGAEGLCHILEATGAIISMKLESNQPTQARTTSGSV